MIIFYLLVLLAFFPVLGFLLAKESNNKAFVFSFSFIVLGLSLFGFVSKFFTFLKTKKQTKNQSETGGYFKSSNTNSIIFP